MAYATTDDLVQRWRPLTTAETATATVLLDDAAVRIDSVAPLPESPTEHDTSVRRIISCEMVKRAMMMPGGIGVESLQQSTGPFAATTKFANPSGDLYLTKADRRLLGVGAQAAFTIPMSPEPDAWYFPWGMGTDVD